jgi:hypothetical protein
MKWSTIHSLLWVMTATGVFLAGSASAGRLQAWGWDSDGQVSNVPLGDVYTAVAAGDAHGLGLRLDGTITAWGQNADGECSVPPGTYRSVGAGADFSLAIRADGSIAAWGRDSDGLVSRVPAGKNFVAVDGGEAFAVALRSDGSLVAWGNDRWAQVSGAPKGTGFKAVVAGDAHGVALRANGSLATWGYSPAIQGTPTSGTYTAVSAGGTFCVALRSDGVLVWWGSQNYDYGLSQVPAGNDFVAVSAGYLHCLALRNDGSIVGWGAGRDTSVYPHRGQANPPLEKNFTAIASGLFFSVALTGDTHATALTDNFDDNKQGSLWRSRTGNANVCWLEEINQRLELRATAQSSLSTAYYVTNNWQLDPTKDFSFKISFHYGLQTDALGWVAVGLTPDIDNLDPQHVEFGPGCGKLYQHLWYEAIDGNRPPQTDFTDRYDNDGVLYVSYEKATDRLFLSTSGYGARYAWGTVSGLLRGSWSGRPLWLYFGGGSDNLEIKSGDAYFDNFSLDTGGPTTPALSSVYRFWSPVLQSHFYTIDPNERDQVIKNYPQAWIYEGPVFRAAPTANATGLAPVYRFWSLLGEGHFYTIDPAAKTKLEALYPHAWQFEGVAFYAYPEGTQPSLSRPVYQFWHSQGGGHFYTISTDERDYVLKAFSQTYIPEGVAFYAFP